jgi:hypothetical protein
MFFFLISLQFTNYLFLVGNLRVSQKLSVNWECKARIKSIHDWGCKKECLIYKGLQMTTLGVSPIYL